MKKWYVSMAALLIAGAGFAQTTSFGIKAGPDFSSIFTKANGVKETSKMTIGVAGGIYANLPLYRSLYLQPSLLYERKGGKSKSDPTVKTRLNYLVLPVNILFMPALGQGNLIAGAGPYLGYGLSGKIKGAGSNPVDIRHVFKAENGLKRLDAGVNVQVGYAFANGFIFTLSSEMGLVNLQQNGNGQNTFRNISYGFSIGYPLK